MEPPTPPQLPHPTASKSTKTKTISSISISSTKKSNKKFSVNSSPLATLLDVGETMANNLTPNLGSIHYSKPPTTASLRFARKLQKSGEKTAFSADKLKTNETGNTSSEDEILKQLPGGVNNNKLRFFLNFIVYYYYLDICISEGEVELKHKLKIPYPISRGKKTKLKERN